jgi:hypothetical protein
MHKSTAKHTVRARVHHKAAKEQAEDIELPQRDSACVERHQPNCGCTGELRGPIESV